jgi:hypothetical protein
VIELKPWERVVLLRALPAVVFVAAVVVTGLAVLVQDNDDTIDTLGDEVTNLEDLVEDVDRSTKRVETFVDDLEEQTPEEAAQQAAVTAAVQQVPEIRTILCQAFPDVPACETG